MSLVGSRQQRREAARESAKEITRGGFSNKESISTGDLILWCLALVAAWVLSLARQKIGSAATALSLIGMAALLVFPIWHLPWVRASNSTPRKWWRFSGVFLVALLLDVAFGFYVWPHVPISIKVTFQDSPLFTPSRTRHITRLSGGVVAAPSYYSHIIIPEEDVGNDDIIRTAYSAYVFNRILSASSADKSLQQVYEEAAWVFMCYFSSSFGGKKVCASDAPGSKWTETMWHLRAQFGKSYTDKVLSYTLRMWPTSPTGQWKTFDQFFMNKLLSGEVVMNAGNDRFQAVRDIAKRHGIQLD